MKIHYLLFLTFLLFSCEEKTKEKEIYYLPEGFNNGVLYVFYNRFDGQEEKYEDDARIYHASENGVIKTKFEKNYGCTCEGLLKFYSINKEGKKALIPYYLDEDSLNPNQVYVLKSYHGDDNLYSQHLIGTPGQIDSLVYKSYTSNIFDILPDYGTVN